MKKILNKLILLGALFCVGCSSIEVQASKSTSVTQEKVVKSKLNKEFLTWKGTKYKWGGDSRKGIDCSAFVKQIYKKTLNKNLPRTTMDQKTEGKRISKSNLKVGDLVFFRGNKHVGIYMGDGKFIHSSTKRGVEMNTLATGYYARVFTQGRRI